MTVDAHLKKILFEGYAKKEGGSFKSWKKRYVRFTDDGNISYYKDQTDAKAINSIDVGLCLGIETNVKFSEFGFILLTGGARDYKFACFSASEYATFVAAIKTKLPGPLFDHRLASTSSINLSEESKLKNETVKDTKLAETVSAEVQEDDKAAKVDENTTAAIQEATEPNGTEDKETDTDKTEGESGDAQVEKSTEAVVLSTNTSSNGHIQGHAVPVKVVPISATSRSGWLSKSGGGKISAAYQRRWLQVIGTDMTYAKADKEDTPLKGVIDLNEAQFISLEINAFSIGTLGRTYNFRAESAETALEWVEHLNTLVPEGAKFTAIEEARKAIEVDDETEEPESPTEPVPAPAPSAEILDKDNMIRSLRARVTELELQVQALTVAKEKTAAKEPVVAPATEQETPVVAPATEQETPATAAEAEDDDRKD